MRRKGSQRGEGQFGCVVGLAILVVALFIAFKMIPIKVRAAEVRQEVADEAKSAGMHDDKRITDSIVSKARDVDLPVTPENITIRRAANAITIDVQYTVPVDFPGYTYNWKFHHRAENPIF
ncbi:MAG: hypothetical protein JJE51_01520 [Thermoanaerobaculia bacterium]|nr:hypothetical protein [Thermoanaerobaculia bacterium]